MRSHALGILVGIGLCAGAAHADKPKADKGGACKLKVEADPPETEVFVDGAKKGTADKVKELALACGAHIVNLKHKGDEHEDQVILKKGAPTKFTWKFEDDQRKAIEPDDEAGKPLDEPKPEAAPAAPSDSDMK